MIKVLLEAAAGSRNKNRYDEKTLEFKGTSQISRPYPYPYGFIIGTIAADGDSVDCYIITKDTLKAGKIVECEPIGLLEQEEDGEVDHKVLAAIPGQDVTLSQELREELREFIYAVFAQFPEVHLNIGRILPREMALQHIQRQQDG
jgi:inorganic pyrophosphatase